MVPLFGYVERIRNEGRDMDETINEPFDIEAFLSTAGTGRSLHRMKPRQIFFPQGSEADAVFYLRSGRAKLTVVSKRGKEATVTLLAAGDFFGEESMAGEGTLRTATAAAVTACFALRITAKQMHLALHEQRAVSDLFLRFILLRGIRTQEDLIDQLFNSSERRLARTLLLMAEFGESGERESLLPEITQQTLAEMIGTTRSRVSFFMNRFRKLGWIDYNGRIRVNKELLNAVLRDQLPEQNASTPKIADLPSGSAHAAKRMKRTGMAPCVVVAAAKKPRRRKRIPKA
jgi:CRP/FNR family transcriptional regulator, cyclic AMP receptor protein